MIPGPLFSHSCRVCGAALHPDRTCKITAHEFNCFKSAPKLVPWNLKPEFESLLVWERRHLAGMRGAETRRRNAARKQETK